MVKIESGAEVALPGTDTAREAEVADAGLVDVVSESGSTLREAGLIESAVGAFNPQNSDMVLGPLAPLTEEADQAPQAGITSQETFTELLSDLHIPDRAEIEQSSHMALLDVFSHNHEVLLEAITARKDSIPFFGLHGTDKAQLDDFLRTRGDGDTATYVSVFKEKAQSAATFLEDLYYATSLAESHADPTWLGERDQDYTPGGIMVVEMDSVTTPSVSYDAESDTFELGEPRLSHAKVNVNQGWSRHYERGVSCEFAGETTTGIYPDTFEDRVLGVVSWEAARDFVADLPTSTFNEAQDMENASKNMVVDWLREQVLLSKVLLTVDSQPQA